jgi:CRP-like cAMP-binding protein
MGDKPPGTESARRASGGQETIFRKRRRRRWAVLTAFPAGGGCLAFGLAFTGHSLRRISVQLPHILGESIEIATGVLLMAAAIAVLIVLILVPWCFWTAIRNVGDQDMANRWLDLATRVVYIVTGGWLKGLRRAPAQLCGELVSVEWEPCTASFWELLVPAEQADLAASAVETTFQAGSILCHEGQRADQVFVIRSGRIAVCVESPSGQQVVAIRHAGDIVGERAALQVGERSATITALRAVTAYVVPTEDFSSFLHRHPYVLTIIENQIYGRLTENRLQCAIVEDHCVAGAARPAGSWNGQNCTIVLIDITNFGASTRCDRDRRRIRAALHQITQSLFENQDRQNDYHCEDRGDGILLVVPPRVPTSSIVNRILDNLITLLRRHNSTSEAATRIQMRVALDVGPVVSDAHGVDGLAIIHAARLLDAPALKHHLAETGADLGFITSPFVYHTIIQPNPGHVDAAVYQQLKCRVKRQALNAWMYIAPKSGEIQPPAAYVGIRLTLYQLRAWNAMVEGTPHCRCE